MYSLEKICEECKRDDVEVLLCHGSIHPHETLYERESVSVIQKEGGLFPGFDFYLNEETRTIESSHTRNLRRRRKKLPNMEILLI